MTDMDHIENEVKATAREGRLSCAAALELANRLGVTPRKIGEAADKAGIKIAACQLGCFQ